MSMLMYDMIWFHMESLGMVTPRVPWGVMSLASPSGSDEPGQSLGE